jgi:hypothetical protein
MRSTIVHLFLVTAVLAAMQTAARTALAAGQPCFAQYHAKCYGRSQVSDAERAMAVSPVNPTNAVARATHLPLVRVVIERSGVPRAAATVIAYSYGVPIALDRPMPSGSRPAMLVTEFVLPKVEPYTGVKPQPGTIPSVLSIFPHKKLALLVAGHFPLPTLRRIALAILGK